MAKFPDKRLVLDALVEAFSVTLQHAVHAAEEVRRDATHSEARPENDKDTRALEQTYLARGQAIRAETLVEQLQVLRTLPLNALGPSDVISAGALIALDDDSETQRIIFLAPFGGGETVNVGGIDVMVVTPVSALGRALLGKQIGDEFELRVRGNAREYVIAAVR